MQYGSLPAIGLFVGLIVGTIAGTAGRSGGLYGMIAGAILFAGGGIWSLPWSASKEWLAGAAIVGISGAVSGAIWCGLFGLLGGWIGKKIK